MSRHPERSEGSGTRSAGQLIKSRIPRRSAPRDDAENGLTPTNRHRERGDVLRASILDAWSTNNRVTTYLVQQLTDELWGAALPGSPRRSIRMLAGHLHNARCMWIKTLGRPHGVTVPASVDRRRVSRPQLARALDRSGRGIADLLTLGLDAGGRIPPTPAYVWRNLPLDVGHVLSYFVAHEGHHRGQIVLAARALGHRLPAAVTNGLWLWTRRSAQGGAGRDDRTKRR